MHLLVQFMAIFLLFRDFLRVYRLRLTQLDTLSLILILALFGLTQIPLIFRDKYHLPARGGLASIRSMNGRDNNW